MYPILAAIRAAGRYGMKLVAPQLVQFAEKPDVTPKVRVEALRALAELKDPETGRNVVQLEQIHGLRLGLIPLPTNT